MSKITMHRKIARAYWPPRFRVVHHGAVLGWHDTLAQAQDALQAAQDAEQEEQDTLERELYGDAGCPGAHDGTRH